MTSTGHGGDRVLGLHHLGVRIGEAGGMQTGEARPTTTRPATVAGAGGRPRG